MKKLTILFLILLFASFVYAPAPPVQNQVSVAGLDIRITELPQIKKLTDHELKVHVFNSTNGLPVTEGVSCYFHLYNETLSHIVETTALTTAHTFDYEFSIGANNFSYAGYYPYIIQCNTTLQGGYNSFYIEATETGNPNTSSGIPLAALILLPLLFMLVMVIGAVNMGEQHAALKITIFLLIPIFFWSSLHFALTTIINYYNFTEMQDLIGSTTYWTGIIAGVILTYFIIYFLIKLIHTAAQKRKEELEYG